MQQLRSERLERRGIKKKPTDYGPLDKRPSFIINHETGKKFVKREVHREGIPYTKSLIYNRETQVVPQPGVRRQIRDYGRTFISPEERIMPIVPRLDTRELSRALPKIEPLMKQRSLGVPRHIKMPSVFVEGYLNIHGYKGYDEDEPPSKAIQDEMATHVLDSLADIQRLPGVNIEGFKELKEKGIDFPNVLQEFPIHINFDGTRSDYEKVVRRLDSYGLEFYPGPRIREEAMDLSYDERKKMEKFVDLRAFPESDTFLNKEKIRTQEFALGPLKASGIGFFKRISKRYGNANIDKIAKELMLENQKIWTAISRAEGTDKWSLRSEDAVNIGESRIDPKILGDALRVFGDFDVYTVPDGPVILKDNESRLSIVIAEVK